MNLEYYFGKRVVVQMNDNSIFRGKVIDFLTAGEDESDFESIIIRSVKDDTLIQLYKNEIIDIYPVN